MAPTRNPNRIAPTHLSAVPTQLFNGAEGHLHALSKTQVRRPDLDSQRCLASALLTVTNVEYMSNCHTPKLLQHINPVIFRSLWGLDGVGRVLQNDIDPQGVLL